MGVVSGGGLEYLNVSCTSGDGLAAIGAGFGNKLRVLDFRRCIIKRMSVASRVELAQCHEIRTAGWKAIGMNCHNVEKLHMNHCWNLNDEGLQALRKGCRKLSILYVSFRESQVSSVAIEVFKCFRTDVELREEVMSVAPDSASHVDC